MKKFIFLLQTLDSGFEKGYNIDNFIDKPMNKKSIPDKFRQRELQAVKLQREKR